MHLSNLLSCFETVVRDYKDNFYFVRKTKWNDSLRDEFRHKLICRLPVLNWAVTCLNNPNKEPIDQCLNDIVSVLHDEADPLFSKKKLNRILALKEMGVGLTRIASLQKQTIGVCVIFIIIADPRKIDRCSFMRKPCTRKC